MTEQGEPGEYWAEQYPTQQFPAQLPPGPGGYGYPPGPPVRSTAHGHGALVAVIVAIVVLIAGTVGAAIYDHSDPDSHGAALHAPAGLPSGGLQQGAAGVPGQAGASYSVPQATTSMRNPVPTTRYTPYSPPSPTVPPLDMGAVRRTVEAFFNGFQDHDLHAVRSAVCPKYRNLYQGTYWRPHGYEFNGWHASISPAVPGNDYTYALVTVKLRNPRTGRSAGTMTHNWVVERIDVDYYICGYTT